MSGRRQQVPLPGAADHVDALTSWDDDATYAVVGCTRLARWLPEGVDVVSGALQRELLAPSGHAPERRADTMAACHAS